MSPQISLQFRNTQSDFTLMLTPVTLTEAEEIIGFEVNDFINTVNLSRATSGECCIAKIFPSVLDLGEEIILESVLSI